MSMTSVAEDIRVLLNTAAKGAQGADLFSLQWGVLANGEEIDKQILVVNTDNLDIINSKDYEQPVFKITVRGGRGEKVGDVYNRARDIYEYILQQTRQVINGNEYVGFEPLGGLIPTGKDKNGRQNYEMQFFTFRNAIGA